MTTFKPGNKFENLASNGYIWVIASIDGKTVNMESKNKDDNQVLKASMPVGELEAMISGGFFQPINTFTP